MKLQCALFGVVELSVRESVSSESGLNNRQKDKKMSFTLGTDHLNGGMLQENTNVLQVLHTEISILAPLVNPTPLPLNRCFSGSKQELTISRNITGNNLENNS